MREGYQIDLAAPRSDNPQVLALRRSRATDDLPSSRDTFLHLFALCAFAVAQPLYDLIGRNAEFLVAHRGGAWTIAALMATLSLLVPLVLFAIVQTARALGVRIAMWSLTAIVAVLCGLMAAGLVRHMPPSIGVSIAVAAAAAAAAGYRTRIIRAFLAVASVAGLVFPLAFVTATPVSRLVRSQRTDRAGAVLERQPPIVLVVFDELNTLTLLDAGGNIDAVRFPNFAALGRAATWFPNAIASYPTTEYALPAILTGVRTDASSKRLPIAADYPANLFTWLAGPYALHVEEPTTALCPPDRSAPGATRSRVDVRALASDLGVLYLYLVVPREIAETSLPALTFKWKDFAASSSAPDAPQYEPDKVFGRAMNAGRADLFRTFVRDIGNDSGSVLHFVHVLLPHSPYEYLSSGFAYPHGGHTPGLEQGAWMAEPALIATAHRRHEEQSRFVDTLVGELMEALKSHDLFDRAIVIVTADHGGSFQARQPQREVTPQNYRDIVPVPMFVKTPYQAKGTIDDRRVSGLDILPTIADALGAQLPWTADGHPMFAKDFPERRTFAYAGLPLPPLQGFDVREEARRMPDLTGFAPGTEGRLLGRPLAQLDVAPPAGRSVVSDSFRAFQSVSIRSGSVPALVNGLITPDTAATGRLDLAIAVNGVVQAITGTARWHRSGHFFSALTPGAAFRDGANRLDVLAIETAGDRLRLRQIPPAIPPDFRIVSGSAGEELRAGDGTIFRLQPHIVGTVDRVDESAASLRLLGWAVDRQHSQQLNALVAFSGGVAVAFAFPDGDRADVVAALGLAGSVPMAYALDIARKDLRPGGVRIFGLGFDGVAGELQLGDQPRQVLHR